MECSAVILAGGKGSRMGKDKAFLPFRGESLIQRTLRLISPLFHEVTIVAKNREPFQFPGVRVLVDEFQEGGPMGGLYTGLSQARGPVFAVGCDMPFLNPELILHMTRQLQNHDAVIPRLPDGIHPLHAVYSRSTMPVMLDLLKTGRVKMSNLLDKVEVLYIGAVDIRAFDPELLCLSNINTSEDLKKCLEANRE